MNYEQQNRDGRYYTRLYNTPEMREGLYNLVKELCERNDFRYLRQSKDINSQSELWLRKGGKNIEGKNISELVKDYYNRGCRYIGVTFTTENSVVARPSRQYKRRPTIFGEKNSTQSELHIDFGVFRIHTYTNEGSIGKKLRSFPRVIVHNDPDVEIDMRNIWVKFGSYLVHKAVKIFYLPKNS